MAWRSMSSSVSSGTNRFCSTTDEPPISGKNENAHWAEW